MPETQEKQSSFDRTKELTDRLEAGMKDLFQSDKYKGFLKTMSHFHHYSRRNIMLINMQHPGATRVASYNLWKEKFNRQVKKGEAGIRIFAPIKSKEPEKKLMEKLDPETGAPLLDKDGKVIMEEMTALTSGMHFKLVPVFDVSQTYGDPLPELAENLTGNVAHYDAFMDALKDISPLPVEFEPMNENQDGYCRFGEKIGIREGMSEVQAVSAAIHEITHARLHDKGAAGNGSAGKTKIVREVEAESCAYVVAQHFGIETSPNSFGYLAEYGSRDLKELYASLDTIRKEANRLISAIDERFANICKERGIGLSAAEQAADAPAAAQEAAKTTLPEYSTATKTENVAGVDFAVSEVIPAAPLTIEERNYQKLAELFPKIATGEYYYQRSEAGAGFMPLSLEWIDADRLSVMHTYTQNGDLMYDPMIVLQVDQQYKTAAAVEFEQSSPPLYQRIEDGVGHSIDGNGNERTIANLQGQINSFTAKWLENIGNQGYAPVHAILRDAGRVDPSIYFNEAKKPFGLAFQYDSEGTAVFNHQDKDNTGSMAKLAHVDSYRRVAFFEENLPPDVVSIIENVKLTNEKPQQQQPEAMPMRDAEAAKAAPSPEHDENMPDTAIGIAEMNIYGYHFTGMLPLTQDKALELYDNDHPIYLLNPDDTESMAIGRSEIETFGGIFGIEQNDWERSVEYAALSSKNKETARESGIINGDTDMFGIYQLKDTDELHYHRFASLSQLEADNLAVDRSNYELAYTAPIPPKTTLDDLYARFNTEQPKDYAGRSLSVSDVVVIQRGGDVTSHYVDNFGFAALPAFLGNERQSEIAAAPVQTVVNDRTPVQQPETEGNAQVAPRHGEGNKQQQDNTSAPPLPATKNQSVYMNSPDHARENNELNLYRESLRLNKECAAAIDTAIKECVATDKPGYRLTTEAVSKVLDEYGGQRVGVVLANTVRLADWDGRYSKDNKDWANSVTMPEVRDNREFYTSAHPAVVDGYIGLVRKEIDSPENKPSIIEALKQGAKKSRQQPDHTKEASKKKGLEV